MSMYSILAFIVAYNHFNFWHKHGNRDVMRKHLQDSNYENDKNENGKNYFLWSIIVPNRPSPLQQAFSGRTLELLA